MSVFDFIGSDIFESAAADNPQQQIKVLQNNLAKTMMITEALWEILRDHNGLNEEFLLRKIKEIDLRDGIPDGKDHGRTVQCSNCGLNVSTRNKACLYCGKPITKS